jgi:hypothetical protein
MTQSRRMSMIETATSTLVGLCVAYSTQVVVFPWFGLHASPSQHVAITVIFTFVSLVRGYFLRRVFNGLRSA